MPQRIAFLSILLGAAVLDLAAGEAPTVLPEFRVEGTPWLYAKLGDLEIRTRASQASLFGPAKNGRHRNGYWAFAEVARRGQATEAVFRECYGMDWAQACAEMLAYLKPKNVGMLEVRMPQVMADVPEVERLKFRDATLEEVRRILGEFNRVRAEQHQQDEKPTEL